ncbi:tumor susceptibility gene 101 protein [Takifugu flavidus]|uniref:tumor susceptibility gene 101 protein n=1 Tax=Takifugu flavidus TaxID=433684 RepID=UPI00254472F9|nr:tumor susceptibility gene 101 protein [Takifugu flavidus]
MSFYKNTIQKMLPKAYVHKYVSRDIKAAVFHYKDLQPVVDKYVYNDGTTKNLMSLTGTIPVAYDGKTYNIPVCVWLEESYPQTCPLCYIKPTSEMMIMQSKNITSNGEVLLPYLDEWSADICDLVSLLQVMTSLFEDTPPLCMKPYREPVQESCFLQFHRHSEVRSWPDGSLYLSFPTEADELYCRGNETSC